jgi:hypothetical protein
MDLHETILKLDNYKCRYSGCTRQELQVHHIIPRSQGGKDTEWNMITLCYYHHDLITRNKLSDEFILGLHLGNSYFRWTRALKWHLIKQQLRKKGNKNEKR